MGWVRGSRRPPDTPAPLIPPPVTTDAVWAGIAGGLASPEGRFLLGVEVHRGAPHFRYLAANEAHRAQLRRFGVEAEVVGRRLEELLPASFLREPLERYGKVVERNTPLRFEVAFPSEDHTAGYEVTLEPMTDAEGRCTQILGLIRSLSDVAQEPEPWASERRFAALVEHSSDMMTVLGADGRVLFGSPAVTRALGWPNGVFPSSGNPARDISAFDLVHPDDVAEVRAMFEEGVAAGHGDHRQEFRLRRADGTWCWVEAIGTNRLDDPAVQGIVVNARDVSERRAADEALRASQDRFRSLVQHASEFVLVLGPESVIRYASPAVGRFLGSDPSALIGARRTGDLHPDDQEAFMAELAEVRDQPGRSGRFIARMRRFDGEYRCLEAIVTNLLEDDNVGGIVVNARDVTEARQAEEALRESEDRFRSAFAHAPIGMALADRGGRIFRVNDAFAHMLGRTPAELVGLSIRDVTHPDDWSDNDEYIARLFSGELSGYRMEKRYLHADGHTVWAALSVSAVADADGTPSYMIGQVEDITERKAIGERLVHQAIHDPLTGLPNRTLFVDRLQAVMDRSSQRRDRIGVLFLDLDNFKVINDSLGHDAGDQLLVTIGHRLRSILRPTDTVARFGGDEFTILCPDVDDPDSVMALAERVLAEIERPVELAAGEIFVTASIGIACSDRGRETPETLIRDADTAMYRAKDRGRRRAEFFDERSRIRTLEHLQTGNALHRALQRGEFELHYQPILELETGQLTGFEALVRWRHPERGLIGPIEFIGLAEETGFIVPIGTWVLETACAQLAHWHAHHSGRRLLTMATNLSPRQLAEPSLIDQVSRVVHDSGVMPGTLWLEITETALMHDTESATSALRALRGLGVHLAVDDFGTGYSSLSHLKRFPIEALKIDQGFVAGLARDPEDAAIVTAVVSLAHALGLSSTAEGVETPEQLAELRILGCEHAQGHLFAEPLPPEVLTDDPVAWLGNWAQLRAG
jgi:diguanylate cyclase (GGDEF)-like protein/PAS domain S-box-containing protein